MTKPPGGHKVRKKTGMCGQTALALSPDTLPPPVHDIVKNMPSSGHKKLWYLWNGWPLQFSTHMTSLWAQVHDAQFWGPLLFIISYFSTPRLGPNSPFNSQCQGRWENVGNEIFYIWVVCIPFGPTIRVSKICQAVSISGKALGLQALKYT